MHEQQCQYTLGHYTCPYTYTQVCSDTYGHNVHMWAYTGCHIHPPYTHVWVHKHLATSVHTGALIQVHKHIPAPTLVHTHLGTYMDPYTHIGPRDPYTRGHSLHTHMGPHTCISTHTGSDTRRHTSTLIRVFIWIHTLMLVCMHTHTQNTSVCTPRQYCNSPLLLPCAPTLRAARAVAAGD